MYQCFFICHVVTSETLITQCILFLRVREKRYLNNCYIFYSQAISFHMHTGTPCTSQHAFLPAIAYCLITPFSSLSCNSEKGLEEILLWSRTNCFEHLVSYSVEFLHRAKCSYFLMQISQTLRLHPQLLSKPVNSHVMNTQMILECLLFPLFS
jgi:hypothetical protein